jgi:hypothetical protein
MGAPDIDPFIGPTPKEIKGAAKSFVGAAAQRDLLASARTLSEAGGNKFRW